MLTVRELRGALAKVPDELQVTFVTEFAGRILVNTAFGDARVMKRDPKTLELVREGKGEEVFTVFVR